MYPAADIPCIQLSLLSSLDPAAHIRLGEALAPLCDEGVLIVGSGLSFHNLRAFFSEPTEKSVADSLAFDNWLRHTLTASEMGSLEVMRESPRTTTPVLERPSAVARKPVTASER